MTSDFALQVPAELESALQLKTVQFFVTKRPWLDLYGINVRPVTPFGSSARRANFDSALIHRVLPDELFFEVFSKMNPYDLGRAACVCRRWRYTLRNPVFWRSACLKAWQMTGMVENYKILQSKYESSWRKMWLLRPRIRTDGLYVSRNTYLHTGVREWTVTNPVHLVCYFRYMRFYPSGRFLYQTSNQTVKEVVKCMNFRSSKEHCIFGGRYTLTDDRVEAAFVYPGLRPTMWKVCLRFVALNVDKMNIHVVDDALASTLVFCSLHKTLGSEQGVRGTTTGANNRMDILSLVTSSVNNDGVTEPEEDILEGVELQEDAMSRVSHRRGLAPFVFVPFEQAETSVLNLPVEKMDFYVPG